jgi:hypothetical protein
LHNDQAQKVSIFRPASNSTFDKSALQFTRHTEEESLNRVANAIEKDIKAGKLTKQDLDGK